MSPSISIAGSVRRSSYFSGPGVKCAIRSVALICVTVRVPSGFSVETVSDPKWRSYFALACPSRAAMAASRPLTGTIAPASSLPGGGKAVPFTIGWTGVTCAARRRKGRIMDSLPSDIVSRNGEQTGLGLDRRASAHVELLPESSNAPQLHDLKGDRQQYHACRRSPAHDEAL